MATGGQSEEIVKRINANLECSICMETYTDPRILDCVHSFCFKCIRTHVGDSPVIKCPLCNKLSPLPIGSGIAGLKSNFFITGLVDDVMHTVEKKNVAAVCGSCDLGNVAKSHCDDCDCELCDQCIQLHRQLKALKLHKVTPYPNDEEIKAKKEARVKKEITDIQYNIAAQISELQGQMLQVQGKIQQVTSERDTTISQVNSAHQRFLKEVENYVQGLTYRIKENAQKGLGDLPNQLEDYQMKLTTYKALEKRSQGMLDLDLDKKVKLCQDLHEQIKKHQITTKQAAHPAAYGPSVFLPRLQFVSENTDREMEPLMEQAIGFLTPIKCRYERRVCIHNKEMSNNMKEFAVSCAHEALDKYGMYQSTEKTLDNIAENIKDRYAKRYNRGDWDCCVAKADIGCYMHWDKFLYFSIDGYYIILIQPLKY